MDVHISQEDLNRIMNEENNKPRPYFEGYSSYEMHYLIYKPFEPGSPIVVQNLTDEDYDKIPLFYLVRHLMKHIEEKKEIKLTQAGNLPVKIVLELYTLGFQVSGQEIPEDYIPRKEADSYRVHVCHIVIQLAGLIKKRNGKISLTRKGQKQLQSNEKLFGTILTTFFFKFSWAYLGYFENEDIGQLGSGFSILLMAKYGHKKRPDTFYSEKYFNAFPALLDNIIPKFDTLQSYASLCYQSRTFYTFMEAFGLVATESTGKSDGLDIYVTKTELFDKLFKILPHKIMSTN